MISENFIAYHALQAVRFRIELARAHKYRADLYRQCANLTWVRYHRSLLLEGRRPPPSEPHQIMSEIQSVHS